MRLAITLLLAVIVASTGSSSNAVAVAPHSAGDLKLPPAERYVTDMLLTKGARRAFNRAAKPPLRQKFNKAAKPNIRPPSKPVARPALKKRVSGIRVSNFLASGRIAISRPVLYKLNRGIKASATILARKPLTAHRKQVAKREVRKANLSTGRYSRDGDGRKVVLKLKGLNKKTPDAKFKSKKQAMYYLRKLNPNQIREAKKFLNGASNKTGTNFSFYKGENGAIRIRFFSTADKAGQGKYYSVVISPSGRRVSEIKFTRMKNGSIRDAKISRYY